MLLQNKALELWPWPSTQRDHMLLLWSWGFCPDCWGQHCVSGHSPGGCPLSQLLCHWACISSHQRPSPVLKIQLWAGALLALAGFPHCFLHSYLPYWEGPFTDYLTSLETLRFLSCFVYWQYIFLPGWPTTCTTPNCCSFHPPHPRLWFQSSLSQNISLILKCHVWNMGNALLECFAKIDAPDLLLTLWHKCAHLPSGLNVVLCCCWKTMCYRVKQTQVLILVMALNNYVTLD